MAFANLEDDMDCAEAFIRPFGALLSVHIPRSFSSQGSVCPMSWSLASLMSTFSTCG